MELEVEERRAVDKPKKNWSKVVEDDMIENSGGNSYLQEIKLYTNQKTLVLRLPLLAPV